MQRETLFKFRLEAGKAAGGPPMGPVLGQCGLKAAEVAKQFNERTRHIVAGTPLGLWLRVRPDKSYTMMIRQPATAHLLRRAARVAVTYSGMHCATISVKAAYEIARLKLHDPMQADVSLRMMTRMVVAQAGGIGIKVVRWSGPRAARGLAPAKVVGALRGVLGGLT